MQYQLILPYHLKLCSLGAESPAVLLYIDLGYQHNRYLQVYTSCTMKVIIMYYQFVIDVMLNINFCNLLINTSPALLWTLNGSIPHKIYKPSYTLKLQCSLDPLIKANTQYLCEISVIKYNKSSTSSVSCKKNTSKQWK